MVNTYQIGKDVDQHLEEFACAFAKRTNLPPDKIIMCHQVVWDDGKLINKYWFEEKPLDTVQFLPIV